MHTSTATATDGLVQHTSTTTVTGRVDQLDWLLALFDRSFATFKFFGGMAGLALAAVAVTLLVYFFSGRDARRWLRYVLRGDIVSIARFVYKGAIAAMLLVLFLVLSSSASSATSLSSVAAEPTLA